MRLAPAFSLAVRRLARRPVRSLLLLQGTVWGVAVAIFPTAVIAGTRTAAEQQGAQLGADRIAVAADPTAFEPTPLTLGDVYFIEGSLEAAGVPLIASGAVRLEALHEPDDGAPPAAVVGSTPGAPAARGLTLASGRWLTPEDGPDRCVVEADVAGWLGRPAVGPGDRIVLPGSGDELEVVGVTAARSPTLRRTNDLGFDVEHPLFDRVGRQLLFALGIPLVRDAWKRGDRVVYRPLESEEVEWVFLRVPTDRVRDAAEAVSKRFSERGRAVVTLHPLVLPFLMGSEIDRFAAVQLAMFLACLVMGGVVMANLGLLTVLRRSREIAIRRVEGATRVDIAAQFLIEGLLLTAVGCIAGAFLAMALAQLRVSLEPVTGFTWVFPWREGLLAIGVALVIGTLASLLPALRASRQAPVDGLVDE